MIPPAFKALGVVSFNERVFLCYVHPQNSPGTFRIDYSTDGLNFHLFETSARILSHGMTLNPSGLSDFHITQAGDLYYLTYSAKEGNRTYQYLARSLDATNWQLVSRTFPIIEPAEFVYDYSLAYPHLIIFGGSQIQAAYSTDFDTWNVFPKPLAAPAHHHPDTEIYYQIGSVATLPEGLLVTYFLKKTHGDHIHFSLWSFLLDNSDPTKILWQPDSPLWHQPQEWIGKPVSPLGIIKIGKDYLSYWEWADKGIFVVTHSPFEQTAVFKSPLPHAKLLKIAANPIICPRTDTFWDSKQAFNPAAVNFAGRVHLLYRAIGDHDTSVLGYANSHDGLDFTFRSATPAYLPRAPFEHPQPGRKIKTSLYESGGGGYGGIEDPRLTRIGSRFYLTYVAYDGRNPPRVALASISTADFKKQAWHKWSAPVLISPPGVVDKNACLLPEKINGKYVIFHRIYPDILIDFVDSLDFDGQSGWLQGQFAIHPRRDFWDSKKIGMGPPPIKTRDGWLAIYQAVGYQDQSRYKIGAMLLDLADPTKVLYRSSRPVLEPEEAYENNGYKFGVVYPCGAVVLDGTLIVYYGGADSYVAAATANLDEFLDQLKFNSSPHLDPVNSDFLPTLNVSAN